VITADLLHDQITSSGNSQRPFEVNGNTFVCLPRPSPLSAPLRPTTYSTIPIRSLVIGCTLMEYIQTDFSSAASRSCSDQHNSCADAANSNKNAGFRVGDCDTQQSMPSSPRHSSPFHTPLPLLYPSVPLQNTFQIMGNRRRLIEHPKQLHATEQLQQRHRRLSQQSSARMRISIISAISERVCRTNSDVVYELR
jgi:hypothetical protein